MEDCYYRSDLNDWLELTGLSPEEWKVFLFNGGLLSGFEGSLHVRYVCIVYVELKQSDLLCMYIYLCVSRGLYQITQ